ncbi:MAG TPA: cell surface glycoprotein related protein [Halococcus sp.]|nr:cell surface glycoprotein related protein [Halococcus sp.]
MRRDTDRHERDRGLLWTRVLGIALSVVVVASALAVAPAAAQADSQTFIVEQGDKCIQVTPLGDGSQSVESFYDYRSPISEPEGLYSSYGTTDIQLSQVSQIFVYRGSGGLSLVFLHDKFGDEHGGFVATADISGMPADGEWVVEDDTYNHRDDTFKHASTSSHIEWASNGNRTDGAVFRGLGSPNYTTITVDMKFNEESNRYPFEEWSGSPDQNQIEKWIVRSGTGETTELDMSEPVQISPGTCSGGVSTFTPASNQANATTTSVSTTGMTATTAPTTAQTAAPTAAPTQTATATPTATQTPTQTASPSETTSASTATQASNQTTTQGAGGQAGTTGSGGNGGSGAFGPGFGVFLALVAALVLAVVALARRND